MKLIFTCGFGRQSYHILKWLLRKKLDFIIFTVLGEYDNVDENMIRLFGKLLKKNVVIVKNKYGWEEVYSFTGNENSEIDFQKIHFSENPASKNFPNDIIISGRTQEDIEKKVEIYFPIKPRFKNTILPFWTNKRISLSKEERELLRKAIKTNSKEKVRIKTKLGGKK